uniref:Single-stranded DNA-binding protein n=1 Tax=Cyanothece sp. (strain PCC 7425 / ATCC 29141) TaxID=395961 RepID=B8HPH8_CYAP4
MSLNVVTLVGRVGSDPDVKFFESGSVKCSLNLAVRRFGRNRDEPDWFTLELWEREAKTAADYVRKGSLIGITGSLKFDHWQDRNTGMERSRPVIRVSRLELLGSKQDVDSSSGGDFGGDFG